MLGRREAGRERGRERKKERGRKGRRKGWRKTEEQVRMVERILYSRKLSREKTFTNWLKIQYSQGKLSQIVHLYHQQMPHPQTLQRKSSPPNFTNRHKTSKFVKDFFLKSFPLYGTCVDGR